MNPPTDAEVIRAILETFSGPFYVAANETQKKRVIQEAEARCKTIFDQMRAQEKKVLATREPLTQLPTKPE